MSILNIVAEAPRTQIDRQNARLAEIKKLRREWAGSLPTGSRYLMQHIAEQARLDRRWLAKLFDGTVGLHIVSSYCF